MSKRSSLEAVRALDRMIAALRADRPMAPEDAPVLHKFLSELRRTGKPDVAYLGLFGNWRTQANKHPGRALILEMARAGIGASAIHTTLTLSPGLYPGARVPPRRTIADWVSLAKKSAGSAKQPRLS